MQWTQQRQTAKSTNLYREGKDNASFTAEFIFCDRSTITRKGLIREIYAKAGIEIGVILTDFEINPSGCWP